MAKKKTQPPRRSSAKKGSRARPPIELELLVTCDSISRDPNLGKATLYGVFDAIWSPSFPVNAKPFALFAQLAGEGKYPIAVHFRRPDGTFDVLGELTIECKREESAHLEVTLAGLPLSGPGLHDLAIVSEGREIGRKKLHVKKAPTSPQVSKAGPKARRKS